MKTVNNQLIVTRNETFTMNKTLYNKDGTPYMVPSSLRHPYFLLTVSSTTYTQNGQYILKKWLDISDSSKFPRFTTDKIIDLSKGTFYTNDFTIAVTSKDNITVRQPVPGHDGQYTILQQVLYVGPGANEFVYYDFDDFILYEDGKYWYAYPTSTYAVSWHPYSCDIVVPFTKAETSQWLEREYLYNIQLVDGVPMQEYLQDLCTDNGISYTGLSNQETYNALVNAGVEFSENFDVNGNLGYFNTVKPILTNTKLTVLSNLQGGM